MTREESYSFLIENVSNTQNGPMVHITRVEKAIKAVSDDCIKLEFQVWCQTES